MKLQILIGTLMAVVVVASCAAEPEDGDSAVVADEVPAVVDNLAEPADAATDEGVAGDGNPPASASVVPASAVTTPSEAVEDVAVVETEDANSPEPSEPTPEATEPTTPDMPEPGGPWIDPRQPDFTKTVPPPQR